MKFILSTILCLTFAFSQAQSNNNPFNDIDQDDIQMGLDQMFNMLDSLPINFGEFGQINDLFKQQFGELGKDEDMMNDAITQMLGMVQNMDMTQMQGLMDNFLKDFNGLDIEGFNFDDLFNDGDADRFNKSTEKSKNTFKKI